MAPTPEKLRNRNTAETELRKKTKRLTRKIKEKAPARTIRMLLDECATAYDELEKAHYLWVDYLHDDKPDADAAKVYLATTSEWLTGIDEFYEEAVDAASAMIPDQETVADTSLLNSSTDQGVSQRPAPTSGNFTLDLSEAMAEKLLPPSVQCMTFGDNPKEWKLFETEFEVNVKTYFKCEKRLVSYLLKFTTDKAKACVKPHVTSGSLTPFSDAWKDLQSLFGTPAILARHILNDLKDGPSVVTADELLNFAREIKQAVDQLAHTPHESDIKGHAIIDDLLVRLSNAVHLRWAKAALRYKVTHEKYPDINEFLTFIKLLAAESNDEYYGTEASKRRATRSSVRYKDKKNPRNGNRPSSPQEIQVSAISAEARPSPRKAVPQECLYCKAPRHDLKSCPAFMGLGHAMKWGENLQKSKMCWKCLTVKCSNHAKCKVTNPCTCAMPYHYLLHPPPCSAQKAAVPSGVNDNAFVQTASGYTILPTIEVICGSKVTYALQDSASTASYIVEDLVKELKLETRPSHNYTRTINGTTDTNHRVVASIKVRGRGHSTFQTIKNVFVCSQIPAATRTVAMRTEDYPYLEGLPLDAQRGETVGLLIGSDSGLNIPLDYKEHPTHPKSNPYAVKYRLRWAISSPMNCAEPLRPDSNDCAFIECRRRSAPERLEQIEADIRKLYEIEREDSGKTWSVEDKMVYEFWERTIKTDSQGHYELPIPFKEPEKAVPNNREYAVKRLNSLYRKLEKTGIFHKYSTQLMSMVSDGFMEQVPEQDMERNDGRVWYLPHFDVIKPDKPGKIRIVMDAKSEYEGICLNKLCYQGPDICNKLFHILLRFREYIAAWSADVTAMYLQVRIPVEQRDMLRVLWRQNGAIVEYRMTSHIFGGIWCSASSTFALRRAVQDARAEKDIADVVNKEFYVDDVLKSVIDVIASCRQPADTRDALSTGKFVLTKFQSSHPALLQDISTPEKAPPIKIIQDEDHTKALGMRWNMSTDAFYYDANVLKDIKVDTKRQMLRATSSLWDPFGGIAPLLIPPKRIFQKVIKLGLDWDEPLPIEICSEWDQWYAGLEGLQDLEFPRAMLRKDIENVRIEIHNFSDASEEAYGCAAYVRAEYPSGEIDVNLLCAKGRIAPVSLVTIPRLELMSAHLATKMNVVVRRELTMPIVESHFWSDSTVTLHYIRNTALRLQTFVANRVSFIHQNTAVDKWHHVRTDVNIADIISRGVFSVKDLPPTWIKGPEFLSKDKSQWPMEVDIPLPPQPLELKTNVIATGVQRPAPDSDSKPSSQVHPLDKLMNHFSSSYRLCLSIAWWRRACMRKKRARLDPITVEELKEAETKCVRHVQATTYAKEIAELSKKPEDKKVPQVNADSDLRSLRPVLVDDILRVGGRLKHSDPNLVNAHPIILPRKHPLSHLLIRREHIKAHLGTEWTLSMLRQSYWIIGARHTLRQLRQKCCTCHKNFSPPHAQIMADLPPERCNIVPFAFTHSGVDLFGPFYVKVGRAQVKRWITLFTCFSIRAIHLEVVYSMSADSFVMALQRFAARRGLPVTMRSDNGTNIVGAESELNTAWQEVDTEQITIKARRKGIEWHFNPPKASEMGGVWERQIRTVRKCLSGILNPKVALDDEVLSTALCEAENLVNSRPITKVSQDPEEGALTPNHLLMMRANDTDDNMTFNLGAIYRRNWKKVCMLRDQFWNKWVKEYLLELQQRKKWTRQHEEFSENELVLLVEANIPRSQWPLGIITKVITGRDGLTREVEVKTNSSRLRRPVTKLVKLEVE